MTVEPDAHLESYINGQIYKSFQVSMTRFCGPSLISFPKQRMLELLGQDKVTNIIYHIHISWKLLSIVFSDDSLGSLGTDVSSAI